MSDLRERKVAVVIPAKDEAEYIGTTVRSARGIPGVDLVVVVDDGSTDDTQQVARRTGAVVVRHSVNRGKKSAVETGAKVVFMRDPADGPSRLLLFLDADLGFSAVEAYGLVDAVRSGVADCAIAALPKQAGAGGRGVVMRTARKAIRRATGWEPQAPLSGQRCMSRDVFTAGMPLAAGWGLEVGLTIDLLAAGYSLVEVPCELFHRATGNNWAGYKHRFAQLIDVVLAVARRRLTRVSTRRAGRKAAIESQVPFRPFQVPLSPKTQ